MKHNSETIVTAVDEDVLQQAYESCHSDAYNLTEYAIEYCSHHTRLAPDDVNDGLSLPAPGDGVWKNSTKGYTSINEDPNFEKPKNADIMLPWQWKPEDK